MDKVPDRNRILRMQEVCQFTGLGKSTVYRKLSEGTFPAPIRLGSRAIGWRLSDLDNWLQAPERRWNPFEVR